jgi:hypothetical protein
MGGLNKKRKNLMTTRSQQRKPWSCKIHQCSACVAQCEVKTHVEADMGLSRCWGKMRNTAKTGKTANSFCCSPRSQLASGADIVTDFMSIEVR